MSFAKNGSHLVSTSMSKILQKQCQIKTETDLMKYQFHKHVSRYSLNPVAEKMMYPAKKSSHFQVFEASAVLRGEYPDIQLLGS